MKDKGFNHLTTDLRAVHPDLKLISTDMIVVADWVRLKCRYGCPAYGKHLCCPPFAPTPDETRRVLSEYSSAIIVRLQMPASSDTGRDQAKSHVRGYKMRLQRIVCELERRAFLSGYYKAFSMASSPCHLCEKCVIEEMLEKGESVSSFDALRCRHKDTMRPSMEACGIDVFKTLENAGYSPRVLRDYSESVELFGLMLID